MSLREGGAPGEVEQLRSALRDVVALTTLPSVWTGYHAEQICHDVVDLVCRMAGLDGVLLSARSSAAVEVLKRRDDADRELEEILRAAAARPLIAEERVPSSSGDVRLLAFPLSTDSEDRLVAASYRSGFPGENDRLLLRIAANQAAVWLQRKRAESALEAESAFRHAMEQSMLAGIAAVDESGTQTYVNRAFAEMVGWSPAELTGARPPFVYWAPEDEAHIMEALEEVIAGRANPAGYELRFRRRNGERFDALVLISPLHGIGAAAGFLASIYDISERKRAERSARFLAQWSEVLSRSLDFEEALRVVGTVGPELADWCFVDLVQPDGGFERVVVAHADPGQAADAARVVRSYGPAEVPAAVSNAFVSGESVVANDVEGDRSVGGAAEGGGLALGVRCFVAVPMTSRGSRLGVLTFAGTRTRTRFDAADVELAEELVRRIAVAIDNARLYRNAQEANRAKDEFLANLSHELRTPMTAILGWVHLLQIGDLDAQDARIGIDTIRSSAEAQARLIDELLDVSRIVTGKLHLNASVIDVAEVVRTAVSAIAPAAAARRHDLALDADPGPLTVLGDPARLQQVFWNLLSNAVKFTPPGGMIAVLVEETGPANVRVVVRDSGEGIAATFLPLVFERFRQAATPQRGRSGLGLGLAIARELVEMHGGTIEVASEGPNRGSTFTVTLPRHVATAAAAPPEEQRRGHRLDALRVLLVDDDEPTRTMLTRLLRRYGASVTAASSADEARAVVDACNPQILITDIAMPRTDGVALLHLLRRSGRPRFPAVAVTAHAEVQSREMVLGAGFEGFLAKPLDPDTLIDEIERALASQGGC